MTSPLPHKCLALITNRHVCGGTKRIGQVVEAAVAGGVQLVQIREKDLSHLQLLKLAQQVRRLTEQVALLFVNDNLEIAINCDADGIHLSEQGISVAKARMLSTNHPMSIGRSVHDQQGAISAQTDGADLIQLGPIFATSTHPEQPGAGLKLISDIRPKVEMPILGVGGITHTRASEVLGAGASGIAVIRAILTATSPYKATCALRKALDQS